MKTNPILIVLAVVLVLGIGWYFYANTNPTVAVAAPTMPSPNAWDDFSQATTKLQDIDGHSHLIPPSPGNFKDNAPAIAAMQAGLNKDFGFPPVAADQPMPKASEDFRCLGTLIADEATASSQTGNISDSIKLSLDANSFANLITKNTPLTNAMMGFLIKGYSRKELWDSISHASASDVRDAAKRLGAIQSNRPSFDAILKTDQWWTEQNLAARMADPYGLSPDIRETVLSSSGSQQSKSQYDAIASLYFFTHPKNATFKAIDDYLNQTIEGQKKPFQQAKNSIPASNADDPYFNISTEPVLIDRLVYTTDDAYQQLLMTACALQAYKSDHKSYPDSLDALVPTYLSSKPYDPFDESLAPLHYKKTGASYLLYSVGADGVDDGGKPFVNVTHKDHPSTTFLSLDTKGDIVAGQNKG